MFNKFYFLILLITTTALCQQIGWTMPGYDSQFSRNVPYRLGNNRPVLVKSIPISNTQYINDLLVDESGNFYVQALHFILIYDSSFNLKRNLTVGSSDNLNTIQSISVGKRSLYIVYTALNPNNFNQAYIMTSIYTNNFVTAWSNVLANGTGSGFASSTQLIHDSNENLYVSVYVAQGHCQQNVFKIRGSDGHIIWNTTLSDGSFSNDALRNLILRPQEDLLYTIYNKNVLFSINTFSGTIQKTPLQTNFSCFQSGLTLLKDTLFFVNSTSSLVGVSTINGKTTTQVNLGQVSYFLAVSNNSLIVTSDTKITSVDPSSQRISWRQNTILGHPTITYDSVAITGGNAYWINDGGNSRWQLNIINAFNRVYKNNAFVVCSNSNFVCSFYSTQ